MKRMVLMRMPNSCRAFSGGVVTASIPCFYRAQKCTKLSSSEMKYVAIAEGFKDSLFFSSVWRLLLHDFRDPCI